jgi:hypothetical protein
MTCIVPDASVKSTAVSYYWPKKQVEKHLRIQTLLRIRIITLVSMRNVSITLVSMRNVTIPWRYISDLNSTSKTPLIQQKVKNQLQLKLEKKNTQSNQQSPRNELSNNSIDQEYPKM